MNNYYATELNECFKQVESSPNGISEEEAKKRIDKFGENVISEGKKNNYLFMFLKQFLNIMIIVLLIAGIVSVVFAIVNKSSSKAIDAGIIFFIVLLNGTIGFIQELKAEKSIQNLKKLSASEAKVLRNGKVEKINSKFLVVGDVVLLEAGDIVPADLRIFENIHLRCDESSLTGESNSVEKNVNVLPETTSLADRKNMAFKGSHVTNGRGIGVVVKTGMETEIGKIAALLHGKTNQQETPIQKNLKKLGVFLTIIVSIIAVVMFIIEAVKPGSDFIGAFMTAVAVAVAAIPESLPAVVTIIMAIGVSKLAKKGAIIKNLNSVETLGCCEVICSDKTGTLTENKMTVESVYDNNKIYQKNNIKLTKELEYSFKTMALCNSCAVQEDVIVGDPTEVALCRFAQENGFNKNKLLQEYNLIDEIPFDSNRKLMSSIFKKENEKIIFTKGGLDEVLNKCKFVLINNKKVNLTAQRKKKIVGIGESFGKKALRVLGFAFGETAEEKDLTFVGLAGMIDPPRKEAFEAVKACYKAKMKPIMITGDHKDTAFEIARQLGIAQSESEVMLGVELDRLSEKQFLKIISNIKVYARVSPENKVRIVETYKKLGKVVAMTGDGVNDAPCIKSADIGIGMGITGTDISKEAADIIVSDDNFATIIVAVEEGRIIYKNIEKTIKFLLSANGAEILSILLISLIFPNFAFLLPVHILFINLITDSFPSIALGFEPPEKQIMLDAPRDSKKHILSGKNGIFIIFFSVFQAAIIVSVYVIGLKYFGELQARTMAFYTFNIVQFFYILSARSENYIIKTNFFKNKWLIFSILTGTILVILIALTPLSRVLHLVELSWQAWLACVGLSVVILPVGEFYKFIVNSLSKKVVKNK